MQSLIVLSYGAYRMSSEVSERTGMLNIQASKMTRKRSLSMPKKKNSPENVM